MAVLTDESLHISSLEEQSPLSVFDQWANFYGNGHEMLGNAINSGYDVMNELPVVFHFDDIKKAIPLITRTINDFRGEPYRHCLHAVTKHGDKNAVNAARDVVNHINAGTAHYTMDESLHSFDDNTAERLDYPSLRVDGPATYYVHSETLPDSFKTYLIGLMSSENYLYLRSTNDPISKYLALAYSGYPESSDAINNLHLMGKLPYRINFQTLLEACIDTRHDVRANMIRNYPYIKSILGIEEGQPTRFDKFRHIDAVNYIHTCGIAPKEYAEEMHGFVAVEAPRVVLLNAITNKIRRLEDSGKKIYDAKFYIDNLALAEPGVRNIFCTKIATTYYYRQFIFLGSENSRSTDVDAVRNYKYLRQVLPLLHSI